MRSWFFFRGKKVPSRYHKNRDSGTAITIFRIHAPEHVYGIFTSDSGTAITLFFPTSHLDVDVDLFHIYLVPRRHDFTSGPAITEILCVHGLGLFP